MMLQTEQKILQTAKTVLNNLAALTSTYKIDKAVFEESEAIIRGSQKGTEIPVWNVSIHDTTFDKTLDFLTISDTTGEPLYLQSKHTVREIVKVNGKYEWKD